MGGEVVVITLREIAVEYAQAYRDCYRWLEHWCPPWRWLLSAAVFPGSTAWREVQNLRRAVINGGTR